MSVDTMSDTRLRDARRLLLLALFLTHPLAVALPGALHAGASSPSSIPPPRLSDHPDGDNEWSGEPCIPSGDQTSIQDALTGPGATAVLCPNAVFELSDTIFFTADGQSIYTEGLPTDSTRALLKIVGQDVATAVSAEGNDDVAIRNVIIDGNRPELGFGDGALINFGRGVLDQDARGHVVEWVKAYEPRGWTVIYIGGPCTGAVVRNNEVGPAGHSEYIMADGISLDCANSVVENNTIVDATDGGIVIFQSPGSLITSNTIRAENRVMFYGISMEDYWPLAGDFTGTRVTGNVDLSTHLNPEREGDCRGTVVDHPSGFQYDPQTSSGTFQPEFEAAILGATLEMWPSLTVVSESCVSELIGAALLENIKAGNEGSLWPALESAPNGERIEQCISIYEPPDISDLSGEIGVELLPCAPFCARLRLYNLSEDTADLRRAEFLLEGFPVQCVGLPDSLGPEEEADCVIEDFVTQGFQVLGWWGFPPDGGSWGFDYPFDAGSAVPDDTRSPDPRPFLQIQNHPNPFNASTVIDYTVPEGTGARVHIEVYDLQGRLIRSLVDADQPPGGHAVAWDGRDNQGNELSSGIYFFQIEATGHRASRKTMLIR